MLRLALKGIRNNPFRYLATVIAIVLGIGFFTATAVLTGSFRDSLNNSIAESFEDVDVAVRSSEVIERSFGDSRQQIPAALAADVGALDGVEGAAPYLAGYARVVSPSGKTVGDANAEAQAFGWIEDPDLNPFDVTEGRAPERPGDVVIDADTFADGGFAIGDRVRVLPLGADSPFRVVGTIADRSEGFSGQALAFSIEGAARVFGNTDVDQIFIQGAGGVTPEQLVALVSPQLDDGLEAVTGQTLVDEFQELVGGFADIISVALQVFAGVALFVGAFVIYNTFAITIAQRTREMALLRAIGALPGQVSRSILIESALVGMVASALGAVAGIGIGYGLIQLLGSLVGDLGIELSIPAGSMGAGVVLGTVITVAAAYLPARRGAKVAPIEALGEGVVEIGVVGRVRRRVGLGMIAAGGVLTVIALNGDPRILGAGLPLIVVAIVVLGPAIVRPLGRLLAAPFAWRDSVTGELARENAARNPRRTATTSLTLMIGVTLVCAATVFGSTLKSSVGGEIEDRMVATGVVQVSNAISEQGGGLDPSVAGSISAIEGVVSTSPIRSVSAEIDGTGTGLTGIDSATIADVYDLGVIEGSIDDLADGGIALLDSNAESEGLKVGDVVPARFQQGGTDLEVVAIYEGESIVGSSVVDNSTIEANTNRSLDARILVATEGGLPAEAIGRLLSSDPTAEVKTKDEFISEQAGQLNDLIVLLYGLLGMSVVVALIGIVNTLGLSIHERNRELGLLRAVGMTASQLRQTIRYESTIIALIGTLIGLVLGAFLGWTAVQADDTGFFRFTVPWISIAIIALAGVAAGVLAAFLPARRAGRMDVLDAIASE